MDLQQSMAVMRKKSSNNVENEGMSIMLENMGTEYNLCHSFMRMTGDQLVQKQLQMMIESQSFFDSLAHKMNNYVPSVPISSAVDFDCSVHDALNQTIATSKNMDLSLLNFNDDTVSVQSRSRRIISRKNNTTKASMLNKTFTNQKTFSQSLDQIKQNCSRTTFNKINQLLTNYQNLDKRYNELQSKQKTGLMKKSQNTTNNSDVIQQNIMLTAKNNKLFKQNIQLKEKVRELQSKLKNKNSTDMLNNSYSHLTSFLSKKSSISSGGSSSSIANNDNNNRLWAEQTKSYLKQRQEILENKQKQIQQVYNQISSILDNKFVQSIQQQQEKQIQCCDKCCNMMKKIKQSLIKYRKCLQESILSNQQLYKKYSQKFANFCGGNAGKNCSMSMNGSLNMCGKDDKIQRSRGEMRA